MPPLRTLFRKASISVAALVCVFLVAETLTRSLEPGPFSLLDRNPYVVHPENPRVVLHRPGFEGRWDGTWYHINSLGLRCPAIEADAPADRYRIVALGDSCTFGKGVAEADTWPRQLETLLGEALSPVRSVSVANLGVNGYSGTTYERILREVGLGLEPDLVVVGFNLNDFPNAIRAVDEHVFGDRKARRLISQDLRDLLGRTATYRWLRQAYYHSQREDDWKQAEAFARGAKASSADGEAWIEQVKYLESIRDQASAIGAQTAVFLFPYESQVYLDSFDPTPIDRLRETCADLELPFVDLAEEFRRRARQSDPVGELFLKGDRYHPNREGYRIVAEEVKELVLAHKWALKGD
ncbi:MAG TPA: SGNH/GDSL hydrolase family protein [Planctomycetes bacterium]|nr:SGNH/GDSL hydrolase family protein [Planctomycetota bacterium]